MNQYTVTFLPESTVVSVPEGASLLQAQILAGLRPDAPCGGKGTCGKCRVTLDGSEVLACQTMIDRDMRVHTGMESDNIQILTTGLETRVQPDGEYAYAVAFDIGTTTVVAYLLDGNTGNLLAQGSTINPQNQFGADVISRIQYAMEGGAAELQNCIRAALVGLTEAVCGDLEKHAYSVNDGIKDGRIRNLSVLVCV